MSNLKLYLGNTVDRKTRRKIVSNWEIISFSAKGCHYIIIFPAKKGFLEVKQNRGKWQYCFDLVLSLFQKSSLIVDWISLSSLPTLVSHPHPYIVFLMKWPYLFLRLIVVWCSPFHAWLDFVQWSNANSRKALVVMSYFNLLLPRVTLRCFLQRCCHFTLNMLTIKISSGGILFDDASLSSPFQ